MERWLTPLENFYIQKKMLPERVTIWLFILGALQYTMLIFGFLRLCSLRQYEVMMWQIDMVINLYYFSIFQYHNNNTTNINNINIHLTVIVSVRVPPLLAYDLSNLGVILHLFNSVPSFPISCDSLPIYPNYSFTLFIQFGRYCEIRKHSRSHDLMTHSPKNRVKH